MPFFRSQRSQRSSQGWERRRNRIREREEDEEEEEFQRRRAEQEVNRRYWADFRFYINLF